MKHITIETERDRSWSFFKLIDKFNNGVYEIDTSNPDTVSCRFIVRPFLGSDKLGEARFMRKAKKMLL